jgi:FKBP-type peptidyl-prolyl cis-trans isomerase
LHQLGGLEPLDELLGLAHGELSCGLPLGQPISFPLDGVIRGWSEGLVGMKVGGRRTLVIPGDMAYGANPPPGAGIAPNETLVFTVDLVDVSWR